MKQKLILENLIGVLNRVIAFSRVHNKDLNVSDCKNILKDVFNQIRVITVDKIQNVVSNYFNISLNEMLSQRRSRPLGRTKTNCNVSCKENDFKILARNR